MAFQDLTASGCYFQEICQFSNKEAEPLEMPKQLGDLQKIYERMRRAPGEILLRFEDQLGEASEWLKVEYTIEGLRWESRDTVPDWPLEWKIHRCKLHQVSPRVLATCLRESQKKTFNAVTWNSHKVRDMIWHALTQESSDNLGRSSQFFPPERTDDALPPESLDEQTEDALLPEPLNERPEGESTDSTCCT